MPARFYLLVAVVIWGWTFVATKICLEYLSPAELLAARFVIALPCLWIVLRAKGQSLRIERGHVKAALVSSALFLIHFLVQTVALVHTSATNTSWIIAVSPLAMAIMAFVLLGERLKPAAIIGIAVAFTGVALLVSGGKLGQVGWLSGTGDWLALASAFTWALYTIATRDLTRACAPMALTMMVILPAAVVMTTWVLVTSEISRFTHLPGAAIVALLYLAVLGMALAQWFWLEGVARVGAARAGVWLYLEPLATTALAVPVLGESFGPAAAAGGMLVLAGVYFAARNGNSGGGAPVGNTDTATGEANDQLQRGAERTKR